MARENIDQKKQRPSKYLGVYLLTDVAYCFGKGILLSLVERQQVCFLGGISTDNLSHLFAKIIKERKARTESLVFGLRGYFSDSDGQKGQQRKGDGMSIFDLRDAVIDEYHRYISSFLLIEDQRIRDFVSEELIAKGALCPPALLQLNPAYEKFLIARKG